MAIDVSELLLDDTDDAPSGEVSGEQPAPKRGRGRPKGSATRKPSGGAGATHAPRVSGSRELAQLLAKLIGGASILVAVVLQADEAAMTPAEANDIARPAARLLAKSGWAQRALSMTAKGGDWIDLTLAVATYGLRLYPLIVQRQQQLDLQRQAQQQSMRGVPVGLSSEDAGLRAAQPAQASPNIRASDAAAAADAARFGGLGFADPDALAAGAYYDVARNVRLAPSLD